MNGCEEFFFFSVIRRALIEREAVGCKFFPAFLCRNGFIPGIGKCVSSVAILVEMPQERREIDVLCRVSGIADLCCYDDERSFRAFCLLTVCVRKAFVGL